MSEHREWLACQYTMGLRLPDGRTVVVRHGDRVLVATDADGSPRVLSVMAVTPKAVSN